MKSLFLFFLILALILPCSRTVMPYDFEAEALLTNKQLAEELAKLRALTTQDGCGKWVKVIKDSEENIAWFPCIVDGKAGEFTCPDSVRKFATF